jgi:hypothetical protein
MFEFGDQRPAAGADSILDALTRAENDVAVPERTKKNWRAFRCRCLTSPAQGGTRS